MFFFFIPPQHKLIYLGEITFRIDFRGINKWFPLYYMKNTTSFFIRFWMNAQNKNEKTKSTTAINCKYKRNIFGQMWKVNVCICCGFQSNKRNKYKESCDSLCNTMHKYFQCFNCFFQWIFFPLCFLYAIPRFDWRMNGKKL